MSIAGGFTGSVDQYLDARYGASGTTLTARSLIPTATKTGNYVAQPGDFVMVDPTAGPITVTAPPLVAGTRWGIRLVTASANAVTASTGSGVFDTNGTSTLALATGFALLDITFAGNSAATQWVGTTAGKPNAYLSSLFDATGAASTEQTRALAAEALLAPKASPALTGTPTVPTASALTSTTQAASTAFTTLAVGVENTRALAAEALLAPLASPALTGNPTVPTQTALNNSTRASSTAYTDLAVGVETTRATAAEALKAPLASPTFTGTPAAPTAGGGTNTTQLATTAFVTAAVPTAGAAIPIPSVGGSAGAAATFMRSDAVPTRDYWHPADYGWAAMTMQPEVGILAGPTMVSGTVYVAKVHLDQVKTITTAYLTVKTVGSGLTASQSLVGLYNSGGTLIGTANTNSSATDLATSFTSTGQKIITLTAQNSGLTSLAVGDYRIAVCQVGTTPAIFIGGAQSSLVNGVLSAANSKYGSADTGRTTTFAASLGTVAAVAGSWNAAIT